MSKTKVDLDLVRAIKTVVKGELFLDRDGTKLFQQQCESNTNNDATGLVRLILGRQSVARMQE